MSKTLLFGHHSEATAHVVEDYPYGFRLRCKIRYWVETHPKHGDRFCSQTTNPKIAGRVVWNKPKKSTYYPVIVMYLNEEQHVKWMTLQIDGMESAPKVMERIAEIGTDNLSKQQQDTLRKGYYSTLIGYYMYGGAEKYTNPDVLKDWITKISKEHIFKCDFKDLLNHEPQPPMDKPDGEMKWKTTSYRIDGNGITKTNEAIV